jgi:GTP-dependent phosphoenolpyruvate carboxykinase
MEDSYLESTGRQFAHNNSKFSKLNEVSNIDASESHMEGVKLPALVTK